MSRPFRLFRQTILIPFAVITLMILTAGAVCAQLARRDGSVKGSNAGVLLVEPIEPGKVKELHGESPERRPVYRDVEREFLQLQLANRSLARLFGQPPTADYASIRKEAAKINQSASRLKASLSLPTPGSDRKPKKGIGPLSLDRLRQAVATLDTLVHEFVWNPFFRNLAVVDSAKSMQASRDLAEIISLSGQIRKCAERLMK